MTKGFRSTVLTELRRVKGNVTTMVNAWSDAPSTIWYDAGDGRGLTWHAEGERRTRADIPAIEYAENDPERLRRLIAFMEQTRRDAILITELTAKRLAELEGDR